MKDYSNYHGINTNAKISNDGDKLFQHSLQYAFESYAVTIDGVDKRVLLYDKYGDNSKRRVIGERDVIKRGKIIEVDSEKWMIITLPEDNKIYCKADLELCNYTLAFATEGTTDYERNPDGSYKLDDDFRPIPIYTPGVSINVPCIIRASTYKLSDTEQILIPDNTLQVLMQYDEEHVFKVNDERTFWNDDYKVTFVDMTQVDMVNGVGIVTYTFQNISDATGTVS